ncbi:MAG: PAS domain-containing protein, partial [Bacteroidota bacterium]
MHKSKPKSGKHNAKSASRSTKSHAPMSVKKQQPKHRPPPGTATTNPSASDAQHHARPVSAVPASAPPNVVAYRATQDGLKAFTHVLEHLQPDAGSTLIVTHNLDSGQQKKLAELLSRDAKEQEKTSEALQEVQQELSVAQKELKHRAGELAKLNDELVNILGSVLIPLIVVGTDLKLRRCSPAAEQMLNIRLHDFGRKITNVDLSVKVPDFDK